MNQIGLWIRRGCGCAFALVILPLVIFLVVGLGYLVYEAAAWAVDAAIPDRDKPAAASDDNDHDGDNDGLLDTVDLCPNWPDANNADYDGDRLGDPCDNDSDADGVPNTMDQCPMTTLNTTVFTDGCSAAQKGMIQPQGTATPQYLPPLDPGAGSTPQGTPAPGQNSNIVSLTYDSGTPDCSLTTQQPGRPWITGQTAYPALYLCNAISAGTETAMFQAVQSIQAQATATGALTWTGTSITIPEGTAAGVWCPNTVQEGFNIPNDTAFPLSQNRATPAEFDSPNGAGNFIILPPIGGGVNGRTFSNCSEGFWAVALH